MKDQHYIQMLGRLTEMLDRLTEAAGELGLHMYTHPPETARCDGDGDDKLDELHRQALAYDLAWAYAHASRTLPPTQVHAADLLPGHFLGGEYFERSNLEGDYAILEKWMKQVGEPAPNLFYDKLVQRLLQGEPEYRTVVKTDEDTPGARSLEQHDTDPDAHTEPHFVWYRALEEDEARTLAAIALVPERDRTNH